MVPAGRLDTGVSPGAVIVTTCPQLGHLPCLPTVEEGNFIW
jgi:hypothetical protein